jgi:hypothetical protein
MVKKKFSEMYPKVKEIAWGKDASGYYTASFTFEEKNWVASYSQYGNWIESKYPITEAEAPAIATAYVVQFYPGAKVKGHFAITIPEGSYIQLMVEKDTALFPVLFEKDGKLFKDDHNAILKKFKEMYPYPKDVKWEQTENGNFDVFLQDKGKACRVSFTLDGNWVETQTIAAESEVPEKAFEYISKNFKGFDVRGIIFVKNTESNFFEVVVGKDTREVNLFFDIEGNFIKKEDITR